MNKRLQMLLQITGSGGADAFAWYALAMEQRKEDAAPDALETFEKLKTAFPDYLPQYLMAGQTALELGRAKAAIDWLEAGLVLAQRSGDEKTRSELAMALDEARSAS